MPEAVCELAPQGYIPVTIWGDSSSIQNAPSACQLKHTSPLGDVLAMLTGSLLAAGAEGGLAHNQTMPQGCDQRQAPPPLSHSVAKYLLYGCALGTQRQERHGASF